MIREDYKYSDITEKIIGCAMKVHRQMRNGFQELIYQRCLIIEFRKIALPFLNEVELPIFYDKVEVGKRRVNFLIENKVIIEIKAVSELTDTHLAQAFKLFGGTKSRNRPSNKFWFQKPRIQLAQALNYLETLNLEIGLLINFGSKSLGSKKMINNKYKQPFQSNQSM
jgi:GxxExxY protein